MPKTLSCADIIGHPLECYSMYQIDVPKVNKEKCISMFHRAFFNSIIDKHQHMHFTFKSILV